ncbi:MAG: TonB-dependent receptor [Muribaculaceae bacterium]|nr:TonB-dependent receptor [Muribaculaceae bacterium]
MTNIRYILFLLLIFFQAVYISAQVKISGKVIDADNNPIEFATIRIGGTAIGVTSDLKGDYSLNVAKRDTIELIFNCIGYKEDIRKLIDAKGEMTLNVRLYKTSHELQELQVTEFKKQTTQMQALDAKSYKLSPDVSGGGIESMLSTMAGVSSKNEMSSQYMVRGGSYDENSVYINGIEVYRPQLISSGQQEGLSIINPDMVGNVSFSTGGFSAEYSDKMSSVLDITYREPEKIEGALALSLLGASGAFGQNNGKFSQLHGIRYKRNASLLGSLESKGEYDPQFLDYQTFLGYKFNDKLKATFLGNIALNNYRFTPTNRSTSFGTSENVKQFTVYFDGQEKDKFETYFGALSLNYKLSKSTDFTLLASGYLTNELVAYDISGEYWLDEAGTNGSENSSNIGGELGVGKYREHARNRLKMSVFSLGLKGNTSINRNNITYGLTFKHESIHDRQKEWELRDSAGYSLPVIGNGIDVIYNLTSNNDVSSNRLAFFAQDSYKLLTNTGLFIFNGGIRFSYWDFNKEFLVSPRISVGFVPAANERFSLRLAGGLYYQSPFYKEYREEIIDENRNGYIQLNNKIKSQRSIQLIMGGDYTFRAMERPFKLTAELYYKNLANLIPYEIDNLKMVYSGRNESSGYVAGVDFKFFGQFVPGTDSWISFSLMKTQEELNGKKVPRPTDQRYSFALFFQDYFPRFPKMKFNLRAIFSDGLPTTAPRTTRDEAYFRTPAYKRIDIGISYQLVGAPKNGVRPYNFWRHFKSIWLGVDVFNLFDISNVSSYYWVTDVNNLQYAVPNYLTRRQINVRLSLNF